jgi:HD superfamily phosphohydrolase
MSLARGASLRKRLSIPVQERGTFGEKWVLRIVCTILDAICHMQTLNIAHRDIKDDNVVCDDQAEEVVLIDFGFCTGASQPAEADSFIQIGATRYSPPSKLRHPSQPHPTHDIFSVGVLAYLLLTNAYPWSVPSNEDFGLLATSMERDSPPAITELNSTVSYDTAQFVNDLIDRDDNQRPSASNARERAQKLRAATTAELRYPSQYSDTRPWVTRDSIHGDIRLTRFEVELVNATEFQRLRYVKQLGFASLAFVGAEHSRFSHMIGTVHIADRIITAIAETSGNRIDPEERLLIRSYALLHDIAHAPFGHTIEDELGFFSRHDKNVRRLERIIDHPQSRIRALLIGTSFGKLLLEGLLSGDQQGMLAFAKEIVDGPAGADVLDYVDRDSIHCGVDHQVDSAVFRHFRAIPIASGSSRTVTHLVMAMYGSSGRRRDAGFAIENLLLQRFALFLKVYSHPAKIAAGAMLGKSLAYLIDDAQIEEAIEKMGDVELLLWLSQCNARASRELAVSLIRRQLFKPVYVADALSEMNLDAYIVEQQRMTEILKVATPEGRHLAEKALASEAGIEEEKVIIYWPKEAPGLQKVRHYVQMQPGTAPVDRPATASSRERMIARHLALWSVFVFGHPDLDAIARQKLQKAAHAKFGFENLYPIDRRRGLMS